MTARYLILLICFLFSFESYAEILLGKDGLPYEITREDVTKYNQSHPDTIAPLWEIGGGLVWVQFPDYPGSDYQYHITLPFPAAVYRGEILRAERDEGIRGRFLNYERIELDLSFDGTLPSRSGKPNSRRADMPPLETVIEFGPKLIYHLFKSEDGNQRIDLNFAFRYGFSSNLKKWQDLGLQFNPFITYKIENFFQPKSLFLLSLGSKWSTQKLMKYYYQVDPIYATESRDAFSAKSGLLEITLAAIGYYPIYKDIMIFGGMIKGFYSKASNRKSPLLPKDQTTSLILGIYWTPKKSNVLVFD